MRAWLRAGVGPCGLVLCFLAPGVQGASWLVNWAGSQHPIAPALQTFLASLDLAEHAATMQELGYDHVDTFPRMSASAVQRMDAALMQAAVPPGHVGIIVDAVRSMISPATPSAIAEGNPVVDRLLELERTVREQLRRGSQLDAADKKPTPAPFESKSAPPPSSAHAPAISEEAARRQLQEAEMGAEDMTILRLKPKGANIGAVQHGAELRTSSDGLLVVDATRRIALVAPSVSLNTSTVTAYGEVQAASAAFSGDVTSTGSITADGTVTAPSFKHQHKAFTVGGNATTYYPIAFNDGDCAHGWQ